MFPLERICIDLIVQNFERFYFAFTTSKDEKLLRNFDFLQRRFSAQLLTALYVKEKLEEDHFGMLINEYLNCLVGSWFKNSSYLNCMESIFSRLPNVTRICFRECDDKILEYIAMFCPKVVEIDVRHSKVTDNGVIYLHGNKNGKIACPDLKNLFIKRSLVTDEGAKSLIVKLPSLEKFDYQNLPLLLYSNNKENLTESKTVQRYNLVELDLSGIWRVSDYTDLGYTDVLKTCLAVCPKLESIACYIFDKQEVNLFDNGCIKKLHLGFQLKDPKINMDDILKIKGYNLTSLKISNSPYFDTRCNMSVCVLAKHCPNLKEFYVHNVNLTDDNDDCGEVIFPSLTKCCLSYLLDPSAAKAICLILSSAPQLESLSIRCMLGLDLEVKNRTLMWAKSPSAKLIEFVFIMDLEEEFMRDLFLSSASLKAIFLNQCTFSGGSSSLLSFAENLRHKPRIYIMSYDRWMCDVEERRFINNMNHDSLFDNNGRNNLKSRLKEDYKCSAIYPLLFTETALFWKSVYYDSNDDWEDHWEKI